MPANTRSFHVHVYSGDREAEGKATLSIDFDEAIRRLERLPRMFVEPDGSFVWAGSLDPAARWQIDGTLQDAGPTLHCVTIVGTSGVDDLLQLLSCFRIGNETFVFQAAGGDQRWPEPEFLATFG